MIVLRFAVEVTFLDLNHICCLFGQFCVYSLTSSFEVQAVKSI